MDDPPPGWYLEDEEGHRGRYWDGETWSDHVVDIPHGATLPRFGTWVDEDRPPASRSVPLSAVVPFVVVLMAAAALLGAALSDSATNPPPRFHPTAAVTSTTSESVSSSSTPSSTTTSALPTASRGNATTTTVADTTDTRTTDTTLLQPATMLDVRGSAPVTTVDFTVLIPTWGVRWSYDCAATPTATAGGFTVWVLLEGSPKAPEPIVKTSLSRASGVVERDDGPSTFRLLIDSGCEWQVKAVTRP